MTRKEKALDYFSQRYNCAQAVLCAYGEDFGVDKETATKLAFSFGGGIGKSANGMCGAVNAGLIVIGLAFAQEEMDKQKKDAVNGIVRNFMWQLQQKHASLVCKDILREEGKTYAMHAGKCEGIMAEVCDLLDQILEKGV